MKRNNEVKEITKLRNKEVKAIIITLLAIFGLAQGMTAGNPKIVAHRGYWKTEGSAQNSIRSLVKADSIGVYGSEFDVWITADDKLIVNHDGHIGDLIIENSTAAQITACKLENGENVPTLEQYLDAAKKLKTRLVFELKSHKNKLQETKAVDMLLKMIKDKKLDKRVDYITFSLPAFVRLIQKAPKGTPVYYLNGELSPDEILEMGGTGVDYHISVFRDKHPEWLKRCHQLGLKANVWTVNEQKDLQWCIDQGFDFITTNEPVLLEQMLKK